MTMKIQRPAPGTEDIESQRFKHTVPITPTELPASVERLITIGDWATALVVSVPTVERLRYSKKIPPPDVMIGRLPRWKPSTVRAWIESGGRP
jgi:predicted DNA-binding transcriptional regulator AlpA